MPVLPASGPGGESLWGGAHTEAAELNAWEGLGMLLLVRGLFGCKDRRQQERSPIDFRKGKLCDEAHPSAELAARISQELGE